MLFSGTQRDRTSNPYSGFPWPSKPVTDHSVVHSVLARGFVAVIGLHPELLKEIVLMEGFEPITTQILNLVTLPLVYTSNQS